LAREESPARLAGLNIKIVQAGGFFTSRSRFEAGDIAIEAGTFLLAIGVVPTAPAIAGIELVRPLTPERVGELAALPKRLVIVGADPENLVLAQAFLRLGSKVVLLPAGPLLPNEDPELTMPLRNALCADGLEIFETADIRGIEPRGSGLTVHLGEGQSVDASHFAYVAHRTPLVEGLGLRVAGVAYDKDGLKLGADRRSSNPRIYAIRDDLTSVQSMTVARHEAEWTVASIFGRSPPVLQLARIIATEPEIAVVGLSEAEARARHRSIRVSRAGFWDNLRARTAFQPRDHVPAGCPVNGHLMNGHVKIITDSDGRLLGAGIVGPQARELIAVFALGLAQGLNAEDLAVLAANEPTLSDVCRTAALASFPQTGKVMRRRKFWPWRLSR
jgi:pyruvate/2-oxoglutarate dehydrogenase complex dihydrolipoamide dehydrogenase (E3) component